MAKASFELKGLPSFVKDLEDVSTRVRAAIAPEVQQTARLIQATAQSLVPRDKGDLARAIQIRGRDVNWRVGLADEDLPLRGGRNRAHRNPSVYGVWYEYGFKTRQIARRPFMGPAVEANEDSHYARLIQAINRALG
jgi:hypothetical protein